MNAILSDSKGNLITTTSQTHLQVLADAHGRQTQPPQFNLCAPNIAASTCSCWRAISLLAITKAEMNSEFDGEVNVLLEKHMKHLKSQLAAQLCASPEMTQKEIQVQGKNINLITWRENLPNKSVFIIGHLSWQKCFLGYSKMDGFVIESEGQIRDATIQEWNEYGGL